MFTKPISLIGMAGCGKTTIGKKLAARYNFIFCDTDILIEKKFNMSLQDIKQSNGYKFLRREEEKIILGLDDIYEIIATGGSAIYSAKAMNHLKTFSTIIFINTPLEDIEKRIGDAAHRGFAMPDGFSIRQAYEERLPLYSHFQDISIDGSLSVNESIREIEDLCF